VRGTRSPTRGKSGRSRSDRAVVSPRSWGWAQRQGAATQGPVAQGEFLRPPWIEQRATRLKANATPQQAADIDAALARTERAGPMGELFKVLAITDPRLGQCRGLADAEKAGACGYVCRRAHSSPAFDQALPWLAGRHTPEEISGFSENACSRNVTFGRRFARTS